MANFALGLQTGVGLGNDLQRGWRDSARGAREDEEFGWRRTEEELKRQEQADLAAAQTDEQRAAVLSKRDPEKGARFQGAVNQNRLFPGQLEAQTTANKLGGLQLTAAQTAAASERKITDAMRSTLEALANPETRQQFITTTLAPYMKPGMTVEQAAQAHVLNTIRMASPEGFARAHTMENQTATANASTATAAAATANANTQAQYHGPGGVMDRYYGQHGRNEAARIAAMNAATSGRGQPVAVSADGTKLMFSDRSVIDMPEGFTRESFFPKATGARPARDPKITEELSKGFAMEAQSLNPKSKTYRADLQALQDKYRVLGLDVGGEDPMAAALGKAFGGPPAQEQRPQQGLGPAAAPAAPAAPLSRATQSYNAAMGNAGPRRALTDAVENVFPPQPVLPPDAVPGASQRLMAPLGLGPSMPGQFGSFR